MSSCGKPFCSCCERSYVAGFSDGVKTGFSAGVSRGYSAGYVDGYLDGSRGIPAPSHLHDAIETQRASLLPETCAYDSPLIESLIPNLEPSFPELHEPPKLKPSFPELYDPPKLPGQLKCGCFHYCTCSSFRW